MWLEIVTFTTVGYGDLYPQTHIGRMITIFACYCGQFLLSSLVVTLTTSTELGNNDYLVQIPLTIFPWLTDV